MGDAQDREVRQEEAARVRRALAGLVVVLGVGAHHRDQAADGGRPYRAVHRVSSSDCVGQVPGRPVGNGRIGRHVLQQSEVRSGQVRSGAQTTTCTQQLP
jgi:hypothetical protein